MKIILGVLFSLAIFTAACEDPAANKPKAITSEPASSRPTNSGNMASAPGPSASAEIVKISSETSTVSFVGSKVTGSHTGGFKELSGRIDLINEKPEQSSVTVDINAASVFADDPKLTEHLKSADFFDVAKFPTASFRSTKIAPAGTSGEFTVTGDLTLHGTTKSVTFPAKIQIDPGEVSVKAEFRINRKDFGIVYAGQADNLIRDDVALTLDVKAPRQR